MPSLGRAAPEAARAGVCVAWVTLLAGACSSSPGTLMVEVDVGPQVTLPPIVRVDVTLSARGRAVVVTANGSAATPLGFPLPLTLNTSGLPAGDTIVEATASDDSQTVVARGTTSVSLPHNGLVRVLLQCQSLVCSRNPPDGGADGGADAPTDAPDDSAPSPDAPVDPKCGNGKVDPGEQCDTARPPDLPGACPTSCDDGIPCTQDMLIGDGCNASCVHREIPAPVAGDGCCPASYDHSSDSDCSPTCGDGRVDPGEACDTGIAAGDGACPPAEESCDDGDPCTRDRLISKGTCSARCIQDPITDSRDDGCCPLGANATSDSDCHPMCGNGVVEPGEMCDPGVSSDDPADGACPTTCDDGNPCTIDTMIGTACNLACSHTTIDSPAPGDGCCPIVGLAGTVDPDCKPVCGNGVLEPGEACDHAIDAALPGSCPSSCPSAPACVRYELRGSVSECSAVCVAVPVPDCQLVADGCCPTGCTSADDPDCSAACGNGRLDPGEGCDPAIVSGAGVCPRSCSDGISCTDDLLVDGGTCSARCVFVPTLTRRDGDGCCPAGANAAVDADCPAVCGNGVVESPFEACDTATDPPSCPEACPPAEDCTTWVRTETSPCDVRCTRQMITACVSGDHCCAPGCNASNDADCSAICGNGVVETTEGCDRGITAHQGQAGDCPASCTDTDPCTLDFARGNIESCTRGCTHVRVTACGGGDRCCPPGCTPETDSDCAPAICGDGKIQAGETCDPVATCPTSCASDGDPCTVEQLRGSPAACTAVCTHPPIINCSNARRDGCCPTGCNSSNDPDC